MQLSDLLLVGGGTAGVGIIAGFWQTIKSYISNLKDYVFQTVRFGDSIPEDYHNDKQIMKTLVFCYLYNKYRIGLFYPKNYQMTDSWVRSLKTFDKVLFESPVYDRTIIFWKGIIPIFYSWNDSSISVLRGTINYEKILLDVLDFYKASKLNADNIRYRVNYIVGKNNHDSDRGPASSQGENTSPKPASDDSMGLLKQLSRYLKYDRSDIGLELNEKSRYIFTSDELMTVFKKCKFWRSHKVWFEERGIAWKFGCGFHGAPGGGKTFLARVIAEELNIPVYVFDVCTLTNSEFRAGWRQMLQDTPAMVLIEDIDSAFDGRVNTNANTLKDHMTFDCLLNCIDGVEKVNGVLFVLTTNKIEKVDAALLRPGRVDSLVEVRLPTPDSLWALCKRILNDHPEEWDKVVQAGIDNKDSMSAFNYRCSELAQKLLWEKSLTFDKDKLE